MISNTERVSMSEEAVSREYTFKEAAEIIQPLLPERKITDRTIYSWVVGRKLAEYRGFSRGPGTSTKLYRISEKGMNQLIEVANQWAKEVKGVSDE